MADRYSEELRTFAHLAQLLAEECPSEISQRRLRIVVSEEVLNTDAGQVLVLTIGRLAPRICHRIDFACPTSHATSRLAPLLGDREFSGASLASLADLIWPGGDFTSDGSGPADLVLGVGAVGDISAGIDRDGALVLRDGCAPIASDDALFAALVSAAIACAQIARRLYPEIITGGDVEPVLRVQDGAFGVALDGPTRALRRPFIVGVGAVGCAVIYALIAVGARGSLLLLDPDTVTDSNLMRYVLFDTRHLGEQKITAAQQLVEASGLDITIESDPAVLQSYLEEHEDERRRTQLVVCAVDTYAARREIAEWLPKEILNCGTTATDLTVSRHQLADGYACLACLYPARPQDAELEAVMAKELGIPAQEVSELTRTKKGLSQALLERVALARGASRDRFLDYVGEPLDTFYNKEFCAKLAVQTPRGEAVAPMAQGSALGGFLLAHALLADEAGEHRRFRMDFLRGLSSPLRGSPRPRTSCLLCGREIYRVAYESRWGPIEAAEAR
jgi:molybdopterin/thiamine biosynthesis adenylyltransferase